MNYKYYYTTPEPFSNMCMTCDGDVLTGLWFECSVDTDKHLSDCREKLTDVFKDTIRWLDVYFSGSDPAFTPEYRVDNLTEFRRDVIACMLEIPYGQTITYGQIAATIAEKRGMKRMSAQAVGGAVGWNPICLIIPCHRVMGANNAITGYGGGIHNKEALLKMEKGLL